MSESMTVPTTEQTQAVDATAWFSVLMHARGINDFRGAAQAQDTLRRLGVAVKFVRPRPAENGGGR